MKIAIELNDVLRDYSNNFLRYYIEGYNHEFDLSEFEFWTNDMSALFPFKSDAAYNNFVYNDYAFELFGKCGTCVRNVSSLFKKWMEQDIDDLDLDEEIEVMFFSPMEYGASIGNTYFFLSKLGTTVREVYMPKDSSTIWNKCDVLVTANPNLLNNKPEGKKTVKIKTEYNRDCPADFEYKDLSTFLENKENTKALLNESV